MKTLWTLLAMLVAACNCYKIVTLPDANEDIEHKLKVFFSTQFTAVTKTVTSTITEHVFETCYNAEPDIATCLQRRDEDVDEPNVEVDGVETAWQEVISPSRVVKRQVEEFVEEVYPSDNVQVVQPDQGEKASVVYPTIVEEEPVAARHHGHQVEHEEVTDEVHEEVEDNGDEHVDDFEDQEEVTTTAPNAGDSEEESTTFEPVESEMTTMPMLEIEDHEDVNPARENHDAPVLLESSYEEKEVVIKQKVNHNNCMEMNNDLFINVMSTIYETVVQYETKVETKLNTVLFKSEGGCLPSNVNEMFTQCA